MKSDIYLNFSIQFQDKPLNFLDREHLEVSPIVGLSF